MPSELPAAGAGIRILDAPGEAEVSEVDVLVLGEEDVSGLDVSVDEAACVGCVDCRGDLGEKADGAFGVERALLVEQLPQVGSLDVAHRDEQGAVRLAGLEDRDDIRVVERSGELRLPQEPRPELRVLG